MSGRAGILLVARREISERLRQRSFYLSSGVILLIVALISVLPGIIGGDGRESYEVGTVGPSAAAIVDAAERSGRALDVEVEPRSFGDRAAGERALGADDGPDALVTGREVVSDGDLPDDLEQVLQAANRDVRGGAVLDRAGVPPDRARAALEPAPLEARTLEGSGDDDERRLVAIVLTLLLYGQLITYGLAVATGVVEEKASRVVEILLSSIRPRVLLAGKIAGIGLLGLGQLVLVVAVGVGLSLAAGTVSLESDVASTIAVVVLWFPLGYLFYAALFAATGALVSRQEDLQSATSPLLIALIGSYVLSFQALEAPTGALATVLSYVPFSSPLVLPPLIALGEASIAQAAISVLVLVVSIVIVIRLGGRIYEGGIMRTGRPLKLREALAARER